MEPRVPARLRPSVLIVGGFLTSPPIYRPMARRLLARGAARVEVAPLWFSDWAAATIVGMGPLLGRAARAIEGIHRRAREVPVIVVGHSAGGVVARLVTSPQPFQGRFVGVAEAVGALVTLGSPHNVRAEPWRGQRAGCDAALFLERTIPGAYFAPKTAYVTVGSRMYGGTRRPGLRGPQFYGVNAYALLLGEEGRSAVGDGLVPLECAHLAGARQITFDDVPHGHMGKGWYGDDVALDRWWPVAVQAWQGALDARRQDGVGLADIAGWSSGSSSGS